MKKMIICALFTITLLAGCGKSPLSVLRSEQFNSEFDNNYWYQQEQAKTTLWKLAVSYCKRHTEKPNCGQVMQLLLMTSGSTTAPEIGHSGQSISVPNF